jgi:hypothetical protein
MAKIKELDDLDFTENETSFIKAADMSKVKKNKGGRPKKGANEKASEQIFINVTKDEKIKIESAAKELGISISALAKIAINKFI